MHDTGNRSVSTPNLGCGTNSDFGTTIGNGDGRPMIFISSANHDCTVSPVALPSTHNRNRPLANGLALPPKTAISRVLVRDSSRGLLVTSSTNCNFIYAFGSLITHGHTNGTLVALPRGTRIVPPIIVRSTSSVLLTVARTNHVLVFPMDSLPRLSGNGNGGVVGVPSTRTTHKRSNLTRLCILPPRDALAVRIKGHGVGLHPRRLRGIANRHKHHNALVHNLRHVSHIRVSSPHHTDDNSDRRWCTKRNTISSHLRKAPSRALDHRPTTCSAPKGSGGSLRAIICSYITVGGALFRETTFGGTLA